MENDLQQINQTAGFKPEVKSTRGSTTTFRKYRIFMYNHMKEQLTTIIFDKPQIWELGPHATVDVMQRTNKWCNFSCKIGGKGCMFVAHGGRGVARVH